MAKRADAETVAEARAAVGLAVTSVALEVVVGSTALPSSGSAAVGLIASATAAITGQGCETRSRGVGESRMS